MAVSKDTVESVASVLTDAPLWPSDIQVKVPISRRAIRLAIVELVKQGRAKRLVIVRDEPEISPQYRSKTWGPVVAAAVQE